MQSTYGNRTSTTHEHNGHTITELLRDLREESVTLVKQEVTLATTELKENASKLVRNVVYLAIGGLIAYAGFIFLLTAAMRGISAALLARGMDPLLVAWLSPAIIGLVVVIIGAVLILKGKSAMSKESLVPKKTIQSLKEDKSWTQAKIKEA